MERSELKTVRSKLVSNIINTLLMTGEKIETGNKWTDFTWSGNNCHVASHKLVGRGKKYMVMEYCRDTSSDLQSPNNIIIFVDYENPNTFYKIPTEVLYSEVNWGLEHDRQNFHITNTADVLQNTGLCISIAMDKFLGLQGLEVFDIRAIREKLPKQYEKLVNKLTNQFFKKGLMSWDQISSMAWEGFALAMNTFDNTRSDMSFTRFAAFAIRNNILTSIDNELRVVKLSAYAQKKVSGQFGEAALFNSVSINHQANDDDKTPKDVKMNMYTSAKFADGDIFEYMYSRLEEQFSGRDCLIFYKTFGLKGYDDMKGKDIAIEMGISEGLVSQKIKKIATWIRKDTELCEMLQNLV